MKLFLLALILISGCAAREPVSMHTQFNLDEHRMYMERGSNEIRGQAFLTQRGGGVVTCAGREVYRLPATAFFNEFLGHVRTGALPRAQWQTEVTKKGFCDAQGNFFFSNIPDGTWHIITFVQWQVPTSRYVTSQEGGMLAETVTIRTRSESPQVVLTGRNIIAR